MGLSQVPQAGLGIQGGWKALSRARSSGGGEGKAGRVHPGPRELLGPPVCRVASPHPLE